MSDRLDIISDIGRPGMSDGPHRTLNMSRPWKRFAERASQAAYSSGEVAECAGPALVSDWNAEVRASFLSRILDVFELPAEGLFDDQRAKDMDTVARGAQTPFEQVLAEVACDAVNQGKFGSDLALALVETALDERGLRSARQVEEHWQREGANRSAGHVRSRVEAGIAAFDKGALARRICDGSRPSVQQPALQKGLDEGVQI
jgi:hypothetical protein